MCGRYVQTHTPEELGELLGAVPDGTTQTLGPDLDDPREVMGVLASGGAPALELVRVGLGVNSVRNNGPELLAPG